MTIDLTPTEPQCIGIVGLGLVGRALAGRLRSAGYECVGFDLQHDAMDSFVALGNPRDAQEQVGPHYQRDQHWRQAAKSQVHANNGYSRCRLGHDKSVVKRICG